MYGTFPHFAMHISGKSDRTLMYSLPRVSTDEEVPLNFGSHLYPGFGSDLDRIGLGGGLRSSPSAVNNV